MKIEIFAIYYPTKQFEKRFEGETTKLNIKNLEYSQKVFGKY